MPTELTLHSAPHRAAASLHQSMAQEQIQGTHFEPPNHPLAHNTMANAITSRAHTPVIPNPPTSLRAAPHHDGVLLTRAHFPFLGST